LLDRDQLETFATIVELQSFERAAGALRITRGAVSQRIKALEQSLAAILLVRDKPVVATPAGETLLRHVQAVRMLEGSTLRELAPSARMGEPVPMAVSVNADSLATWFRGVLWALLRERGVALEVIVDDLDHTATRLARGQVMGCVTAIVKESTHTNLRPITKVVGGQSLVTPKVLQLARWIAAYYCCPPEIALKSVLPEVVRKEEEGWRERLRAAGLARARKFDWRHTAAATLDVYARAAGRQRAPVLTPSLADAVN